MRRLLTVVLGAFLSVNAAAFPVGKIAYRVLVLDEQSGRPVKGVSVKGIFTDIPVVWGGRSAERIIETHTDADGACRFMGKSNHGTSFYKVGKVDGYYDVPLVKYFATNQKRDFLTYRCEPYDCVFTTLLQRVEQPIPMWVRRVGDHINRSKVGHWSGTNMVLRYDFIKGDYLPPDGKGKVADFVVDSRVTYQETTNVYREVKTFFDITNVFSFPGDGNGMIPVISKPTEGIKLRIAPVDGYESSFALKCGTRKLVSGPNLFREQYAETNQDRCYYFRIRSKYDEDGNLVKAYYGKIYGDFKISGGLEDGSSIGFLYYLNPTPLDRNLEWDMKTNLCPNPGSLGQLQP